MKPARRLPVLLGLLPFAACTTAHDWQVVRSAPMAIGACYDGVVFVAENGGFQADIPACDRGNGVWQSRWRRRSLGLGFFARYRLRVEMQLDDGSKETGWEVLFYIEQQKVKDLRKTREPEEADWSHDGQDQEAEALFQEKLARRIAVKP